MQALADGPMREYTNNLKMILWKLEDYGQPRRGGGLRRFLSSQGWVLTMPELTEYIGDIKHAEIIFILALIMDNI